MTPRFLLPVALAAALALVGSVPGFASPAASPSSVNPAPVVLPALRQWTGGAGDVTLGASSRVVVDRAAAKQLLGDAHTFADDLARLTDLRPIVVVGQEPAPGDVFLTVDPTVGHSDGYQLSIADSVRVVGGSALGTFYGEQTVEQILAGDHGHARLPRGVATDWPAYGYRGVLLDMGRHYYSDDYVLDQIRQAAWDKLSTIHMHFTEQNAFRLQSTTYPGLAAPQSYSHADIARFVDYARRYHVTILPEIDVPGHSVPIGQYDPALQWDCPSMNGSAYQHWPGYTLDITKPATTTFVTNLLKEFVPLFGDSPVFHLGGDEYPELAAQQQCPELVSYAQSHGYASTEDVFVDWLNKMAGVVSALGKRPEIWNWWDVAGGATLRPDKDIIINAWTGSPDAYLAAGYDTVSSPGNLLYVTPLAPPGNIGVDDVSLYRQWTPETNSHLLGYEVSRWSDNAVTMPDAYFDWFAQRPQQVLADRVWGGPRTYDSVYAFEDAVDHIGTAPGVPEYGAPEDVALSGTPYGTSPAWGGTTNTYDKAFDSDPGTFFDYAQADGGYTGIDLGAGHAAPVTAIRFVPRAGQPSRMVGGVFQGCTDGPDSGCHTIATVAWTPSPDWHQLLVTDPTPYRWLRYVGPPGGFCDVAEIQFYTHPGGGGFGRLSASATWQPGGHYLVEGSFTDSGDQPLSDVDITLSAYSVDNNTRLPVTPARQAFVPFVAPGQQVLLAWLVTVPPGAPAGTYRLTGHATYHDGDTARWADRTTTTLVPYPSLAAAFDNVAITDDGNTQPADLLSGFDDYSGTFSAQALAAAGAPPGGTLTRAGLTLRWPSVPAGTPDNVIATGQTIDLHGSGSTLGFLASAGFGPAGGTGTITYTDGSTRQFTVSAPDWTSIPAGADVAVSTPYHNLPGPATSAVTSDIYLQTVSIDPARTIATVTLPVATGSSTLSTLHIFAIAIGS
jgi:hypothetical protein